MKESKKQASTDSEKIDMADIAVNFMTSGLTVAQIKGMTPEQQDAIYGVAHNLYTAGKYKDALSIFKFLTFFNHLSAKFWFGLAACQQMLKRYEEAIASYSYVLMLDPVDSRSYLFMADCNLALDEKYSAIAALELCVELSGDRKEAAADKKKAIGLLNLLTKDDTEEKK